MVLVKVKIKKLRIHQQPYYFQLRTRAEGTANKP